MTATDADRDWNRFLAGLGALAETDMAPFAGLSATDWRSFQAQCDLHWVSPLAYRKLRPHRARLDVPPDVWRGFKRAHLLSRARTRRADVLLAPILQALHGAEVRAIALKGLHLAASVYDDPSERPMVDADLLVPPEDLPRAARIVESFGYSQGEAAPISLRGDPFGHHLEPFRIINGPPIELHHDLEAPALMPKIDVGALRRRAVPIEVAGAPVLALGPEDCLLHLCCHAASHHLFGLKALSLYDVPQALGRWGDRFDWDAFWRRAQQWGANRSAVIVLALVAYRLGCKLPDGASRHLPPATDPALVAIMDAAEALMRAKAEILAARRPMIRQAIRTGSAVPGYAFGGGLPLTWQRTRMTTARLGLVWRRFFPSPANLAGWFGMTRVPAWYPLLYPVRLAALARRLARPRPSVPPGSEAIVRRQLLLSGWLRKG